MANGSFPSISGVPPTESIGGVRCGTPGPWPGIALVHGLGSGNPRVTREAGGTRASGALAQRHPRPLARPRFGHCLGLGHPEVHARGRRDALDLRDAAARAGKLAPLLLRREVRGRAEPALEAVTLAAKQIENNHLTDSTMLRMARYRNDPAALQDLVQADRVHRDVYLDPELFQLEMERLWSRAWIYAGHESQIRNEGDYLTVDVAGQPLIVLRHGDRSVRVLVNRCAHKATKRAGEPAGNCGKTLRCPYHAWTYRLDGSILNIPLAQGYDGTRLAETEAGRGLAAVENVATYRGFIFVRLSPQGLGFRDYFGASLSSIDNLADRSPEGELEIAGGCLRYLHNCNWKLFVENLNDMMHPMIAHASSAGTARRLWEGKPADAPKPMAIEQIAPFASDYNFFDDMGIRVYPHGPGFSGVNFSIHSSYAALGDYEALMKKAHGEERARHILGTVRHNTVYYPSLTLKGAIQSIRVARPLAADRSVIES